MNLDKYWKIDEHLQKNEKVIILENPSILKYMSLIILSIFFIWTIIIPIFTVIFIILDKNSTKYILTNKRICVRKGVFSEYFNSISFNHITGVKTQRGIIQKIFKVGNIIIDTSGTNLNQELIWKHIKEPIKYKNKIEKNIK